MLVIAVLLYLLTSIAIGLFAARKVRTSTDYIVAGRSLPLYITIATVFATWFGSETVLGIPATFLDEGLAGIISDPFGASMCLILVGLLFARPLYRMKLLTISDFYRQRYGRNVELLISIAICLSYLGWVAAQIMALGLVFDLLSQGVLGSAYGMMLGTGIVLLYTLFGGMWAVALNDFMQMMIIVIGLIVISFFVSDMAGGALNVVQHAVDNDKFIALPEWSWTAMFGFIAAWITMGFGSIPQQDVFQRVMSAKNEKTAAIGTITGGILYLLFAFIPIFLAYSALLVDPASVAADMENDSQRILPGLILNHTPVALQILFFGALLSAIMSTASATLLAPSVVFTGNILKPLIPNLSDKSLLRLTRLCVVIFTIIVLTLALNSSLSIFEMVENAYKITLAGAFVPLFAGVYWKRANNLGAMLSIIAGIGTWLLCETIAPEGNAVIPPQLAGFFASCIGMIIGSYANKSKNDINAII